LDRRTGFLLLLGLLLGGAARRGAGTTSSGGGSTTGADVGQEVLDVLALESLYYSPQKFPGQQIQQFIRF